MNNIIFFGPPGAGKGTQAKIISNFLKLPHLSTGDILRSKIEQNDKISSKIKNIIANGKLVSDEILNQIVSEKITNDCDKGFILDGYPRTLDQAIFLNNLLLSKSYTINSIFNIDINYNTLEKRILKRSLEEQREDDNKNVIKTRYLEYTQTTKKVSDFYRQKYEKKFYNIDGTGEIEKITNKIKEIIKNS